MLKLIFSTILLLTSISNCANANQCKDLLDLNLRPIDTPTDSSDFSSLVKMRKISTGGKSLWRKEPTNFFRALAFFLKTSHEIEGTGYNEGDELVSFYIDGINFIGSLSPKSAARFAKEISLITMLFTRRDSTQNKQLKILSSAIDKALKLKDNISREGVAGLLSAKALLLPYLFGSNNAAARNKELTNRVAVLEEMSNYIDELQNSPLKINIADFNPDTYISYQIIAIMAFIDASKVDDLDLIVKSMDLIIAFNRPFPGGDSSSGNFDSTMSIELAKALRYVNENAAKLPAGSYQRIQASLEMVLPPSIATGIFLRSSNERQLENYDALVTKIATIENLKTRAEMYMKIYAEVRTRMLIGDEGSDSIFSLGISLTSADQERVIDEFLDLAYETNPSDMGNLVPYHVQKIQDSVSNSEDPSFHFDALAKIFLQASGYILKLSLAFNKPGEFIVPESNLPFKISLHSLTAIMMLFNELPPEIITPFILSNLNSLGDIPTSGLEMIENDIREKKLILLPLVMGLTMTAMALKENPANMLSIKFSNAFEPNENDGIADFESFLQTLIEMKFLDDYSEYIQIQRAN